MNKYRSEGFTAVTYHPIDKKIIASCNKPDMDQAVEYAMKNGSDEIWGPDGKIVWTRQDAGREMIHPCPAPCKISGLADALDKIRTAHGDVYVSIRHSAAHEFSPQDDLTDLDVIYDAEVNMAVIQVTN